MQERPRIAAAVVGVSANLPDAPNARAFWDNLVEEYETVAVPGE